MVCFDIFFFFFDCKIMFLFARRPIQLAESNHSEQINAGIGVGKVHE